MVLHLPRQPQHKHERKHERPLHILTRMSPRLTLIILNTLLLRTAQLKSASTATTAFTFVRNSLRGQMLWYCPKKKKEKKRNAAVPPALHHHNEQVK